MEATPISNYIASVDPYVIDNDRITSTYNRIRTTGYWDINRIGAIEYQGSPYTESVNELNINEAVTTRTDWTREDFEDYITTVFENRTDTFPLTTDNLRTGDLGNLYQDLLTRRITTENQPYTMNAAKPITKLTTKLTPGYILDKQVFKLYSNNEIVYEFGNDKYNLSFDKNSMMLNIVEYKDNMLTVVLREEVKTTEEFDKVLNKLNIK